LRLPHVLDNQLTDGGEVVSLTHRPPFTPRKIPQKKNSEWAEDTQSLSHAHTFIRVAVKSTETIADIYDESGLQASHGMELLILEIKSAKQCHFQLKFFLGLSSK
jgi:hypothetical protein